MMSALLLGVVVTVTALPWQRTKTAGTTTTKRRRQRNASDSRKRTCRHCALNWQQSERETTMKKTMRATREALLGTQPSRNAWLPTPRFFEGRLSARWLLACVCPALQSRSPGRCGRGTRVP
jgi:hypothetical protein